MTENNSPKFINAKGQTLLEFLLLFAVIIGLSFIMLRIVNINLATRWHYIANQILGPSADPSKSPRISPTELK